jgi:hypothetical protein
MREGQARFCLWMAKIDAKLQMLKDREEARSRADLLS